MDTGNKTLAQLSEEGKEARYVTVEVASKLSGYTKEYLERLCALHKVNFLLWNGDQYAFELDSLLKETHTILLSYEGLTFLEKNGLAAPSHPAPSSENKSGEETAAQNAAAHPSGPRIPHFVENGRLPLRESDPAMFSFTGRAVVSDLQHPGDTSDEGVHIPISALHGGENNDVHPVLVSEDAHVVQEKNPEVKAQMTPLHIPITHHHEPSVPSQDAGMPVLIPVVHESRISAPPLVHDDWEERLFGAHALPENAIPSSLPPPTPSSAVSPISLPYHPIHTSVDVTLHHEDMPLFPKLIAKKALPPALSSLPEAKKDQAVIMVPPTPPLENAPRKIVLTTASPTAPLLVGAIHHAFPSEPGIIPRLPTTQQKNLPTRSPEHHLAVLESHPLMKSVGFNMSFALLFLIPAFIVFSGTRTTTNGDFSATKANLAAVGAADGVRAESKKGISVPPSTKEEKIEFSDEVVVAEGEGPHSVLVQPLFRKGAGAVHEYMNARLESGTTSPTP